MPLSRAATPCRLPLYKGGGQRCCRPAHRCRHPEAAAWAAACLGEEARWAWADAGRLLRRGWDAFEAVDQTELAAAVFRYLFKRDQLPSGGLGSAADRRLGTLATCARQLAGAYARLDAFARSPRCLAALTACQVAWRARRAARLPGPWPRTAAVNEADPFTLAPLAEVPHVFSYAAPAVYAFSAPDLARYMEAAGALNPFTRQRIPDADVARLRTLLARLPKAATAREEVVWRTASDAFADVLHDYERIGFYSLIHWFTTLAVEEVYEVFEALETAADCFALAALDAAVAAPNGAHFALARAMRQVMQQANAVPSQFHLICRLFAAVARANRAVRIHLPDWTLAGARTATI